MNRFRFFISFCLILGLGVNAVSLWGKSSDPRTGGWAHERSNLKPDPRVIWGELANGMRYALMPHQGVTGRVSLEFLVLAGSLDEEEHERGLAHFTEHMAFNGTRHFKQEDMLAFSQKLGMTFGADVNAHTGIDQTVYLLQYKQNDEALLKEGFRFLRDIADGITFDANEIEKERGVILSELRGRDGIQFRLSESAKKFVFEGLSLADRNPIGLTEIINSADRDTFLKFYEKWYRPDLMVLVAVGDFDPEFFEKLIEETFSDLKRPREAVPKRDLGRLVRSKGLKGHIYRISDVGTVFIQAASIRKQKKSKDSIAARKKETLSHFSAALLGDRVNKAISRTAGGSADYSILSGHVVSSASLTMGGGDWRHGILSLDQVLRYTEKNGFRKKDIEWVRKRMLTDVQRNLSLYPTLDPAIISGDLVKSIVADKVFIGLDRELKLRDQVLRELTPKSVHRAFSDDWDLNNLRFHLAGEVSIKGGSKTVLKEVKKYRSEQLSYSPLQERLDVAFEPVDWGEKGVIKETKRIPEFDATLLRFENNVRLNFIHSDQEPGIVRAIVRVGDGLFELPENRIGLREFGLNTVLGSGTSHYRAEEIQSILSVSMQGFSFDVKDHDSFSFRGGFSSYELDTFLGIVTDFLYWPIFTKAAHQSAKMSSAMARMGGASGIGGGLQMLDNYLYRDDARFAWGGPRDYGSLRVSAVENWLKRPLTSGYVEVSLIGDISEEEAIDSVARTLGTLKERAAEKKQLFSDRAVEIKARPGSNRIEFVGEDHLAGAVGIWPVMEELDMESRMAVGVLSKVLGQRLVNVLREELSLTYSPRVDFVPYIEYPKYALIRSFIDCSPTEADRIAEVIAKISSELAEEGITDEELKGAINPMRVDFEQALKTNEYLLDRVLKRAQSHPESVEELLAVKEDVLSSVPLEKVNQFAKSVLKKRNTYTASIVPKPFVGIYQAEDGASAGTPVIGR